MLTHQDQEPKVYDAFEILGPRGVRSGHRYDIIKLGWGFGVQEAICPSSVMPREGA